ncbi:MAG: cytochrome c [Gammaproteobacteria bacterium]|nr:cytochrome c [Gammaproteobacteria bacterium]MXY57085.1 cytochrome c [Gammaproteobacteria bacterium]MYF29453.1 cytochrome c [Gammaproteobacteria bacterium]MYK47625.1 cytochrome c [Gammaproteobacteria bacterium]
MRNPFATVALSTCLVALAVSASEGEVNYRQHTMSAIGGHMRAVVDIVRGDVPHMDHLATHASAMADLAEIAPTLFPESSKGGDALDAIWEDGEDFASKLNAFKEATAAFKTAAASGDRGEIMGAFRGVGQACKGCHDDYRAE